MKRLLILSLTTVFLLSALFASAQVTSAKNEETKAKVKTQNVKMKVKGNLSAIPLPYQIGYSSQFIIGDPAYSKLVLDLWKDFDNNTFDRNPGAFADTVAMRMTNGNWLRGFKEVVDGAKTYRSSLASAESTIDAVTSLHSIDRDEDWVLVWGTTKETTKSGDPRNVPLHELWRINKDGKVDLMMQFTHGESKQ